MSDIVGIELRTTELTGALDRGKYVGIICIWIRIFCGYNINTGKVWYQKN